MERGGLRIAFGRCALLQVLLLFLLLLLLFIKKEAKNACDDFYDVDDILFARHNA